VLICCELESFSSARLIVDGVPYFMYVQVVPVTGKGEDNDFNKNYEC